MTKNSDPEQNANMRGSKGLHYALCEDVELIRQPYGAAIWKQSQADFAITNETGRIILESCAKNGALDDIVREVASEVGAGVKTRDLKSDIEEFLASAERNGHVTLNFSTPPTNGSVTGSLDYLSLVRADLSITSRCNLRCSYCYAGTSRELEELNTQQWKEVFAKLSQSGAKKFIITGGEPFVRDDMLQLLQTANALGIIVTLLTNGTLIDANLAREMAALGGLREVKVSLDSLTSADIHDRFRGVGSWESAIHALRLLQDAGIKAVVNMTIHPFNCEAIFTTAEACARNGWLLEASPVVFEGLATKNHLLASGILEQYLVEYKEAIEAFPQTLRVNESEITPEWEVSFRCAMLFGTVGISPDGRLKPCLRSEAFFRSLYPMFCNTPTISDLDAIVLEDIEFFRIIQQVRSSFVPQPSECGNCMHLHGTCNGCVVAKWFVERKGQCPRKEVRQDEDGS